MKKILTFFQKNRKRLFFLVPSISLILLATLIYSFKSVFIAALVNNKPISRFALDRQLEKQGGQQALENLVMETLIFQEAKKKGVIVSASEVEQKIAEIEKQFTDTGQKLDDLLASQGQTRKDLAEQLKIQLLVEKLLGNQAQISDEEIAGYFEKNKNLFSKGATLENEKDEIKSRLTQQKLSESFQNWAENLKKEAKISYFIQF